MSIHFLDENDEPGRECPSMVCIGGKVLRYTNQESVCGECNGTGTLPGNPDGPKVEVTGWDDYHNTGHRNPVTFGYRFNTTEWIGNFPTESAALEAARQAWREEE